MKKLERFNFSCKLIVAAGAAAGVVAAVGTISIVISPAAIDFFSSNQFSPTTIDIFPKLFSLNFKVMFWRVRITKLSLRGLSVG